MVVWVFESGERVLNTNARIRMGRYYSCSVYSVESRRCLGGSGLPCTCCTYRHAAATWELGGAWCCCEPWWFDQEGWVSGLGLGNVRFLRGVWSCRLWHRTGAPLSPHS